MNMDELDAFLRRPRPDEVPGPLPYHIGTVMREWWHDNVRGPMPVPGTSFFINLHGRLNTMAAHGHDYYEIMYVLDGSVTHVIEGERIVMPPASLLLMRPGVVHEVLPCGMGDIAVSIVLGEGLLLPRFMSTLSRLPAIGPMFREDAPRGWLMIPFGEASLAQLYGRQLLCGYFDPDSHSAITTELLLLLFLTEADRAARPEAVKSEQGIQGDIERIARYIQAHCADVTPAQVAREFGYTENYITRALKKYTGMGFVRYRNTQCLMAATALLAGTGRSVAEIAGDVGIPSVSHFYKLFVEEYHMTPNEYRARCAGEGGETPQRKLPQGWS